MEWDTFPLLARRTVRVVAVLLAGLNIVSRCLRIGGGGGGRHLAHEQ